MKTTTHGAWGLPDIVMEAGEAVKNNKRSAAGPCRQGVRKSKFKCAKCAKFLCGKIETCEYLRMHRCRWDREIPHVRPCCQQRFIPNYCKVWSSQVTASVGCNVKMAGEAVNSLLLMKGIMRSPATSVVKGGRNGPRVLSAQRSGKPLVEADRGWKVMRSDDRGML